MEDRTPGSRSLRAGWPILVALLLTTACQEAEVTEPEVQADSIVAIELFPAERVLSAIGIRDRLGALEVWSDGSFSRSSRAYPEVYTWESEDPAVATVDSLGIVTTVGEGTVRIRAMSGGVSGTADVTVREVVREAWSFRMDSLPGPITVGEDGTIYAADRFSIHMLSPDGAIRGEVDTGAQVWSAPAIGPDGVVYVGRSHERKGVMAVNRSGTVVWTTEGEVGDVSASPALGPDGTIYAVSRDSTLYAIDQAGQTTWAAGGLAIFLSSSPALAEDGTVLVGTESGGFYAFNPDGTQRWLFLAGGPIRSAPAIGRDGTIYFSSNDQHLYALTPEGSLRWQAEISLTDVGSSPAIGADGTIYIGGRGLRAFDPAGALVWMYPGTNPRSGFDSFGSPVVGPDGTIYTGGRHLFAVSPDGTLSWDYPLGGSVSVEPVIGVDGRILAASRDSTGVGTLHAITEMNGSNGGFENAPWPKARGNRANTGRAGG